MPLFSNNPVYIFLLGKNFLLYGIQIKDILVIFVLKSSKIRIIASKKGLIMLISLLENLIHTKVNKPQILQIMNLVKYFNNMHNKLNFIPILLINFLAFLQLLIKKSLFFINIWQNPNINEQFIHNL